MSSARTASPIAAASAGLAHRRRFGERTELLQDLGRAPDGGVLRRHVEEIDRVRGRTAVVDAVVRHEDAEVVGEAVDDAAAHATAGRAAGDDERVRAQIDEVAHEWSGEDRTRMLLWQQHVAGARR